MLLLKVIGLSRGQSGVHLNTVQRLIDFYNHDILPVVYSQGSLGASGDLAPLAHLCLPLLGDGEVWYEGKREAASVVAKKMGWEPLRLQSKEGLALLNGTQFMSACACYLLFDFAKLFEAAHQIAALSFEAFSCRPEPFDALIHEARPHRGQVYAAARMRELLRGSEFAKQKKTQVQDPYSFRCIPQVHGASFDTWLHACRVTETEIQSATDNPLVFPEEGKILSGGNFHGQALSFVLDFLAIATAELASISERRTYLLISGQRGLPPFLTPSPGLHSGFMIPQYTAASIVSINKQYCTPASVDSIVSSNGQEDHVSMGANAAVKCLQVMQNSFSVLSIELMNAAQAWDFRKGEKTSSAVKDLFEAYRKHVAFVSTDTIMQPLMERSLAFVRSYFSNKLPARM
jgi:histidine ammonia-lyase